MDSLETTPGDSIDLPAFNPRQWELPERLRLLCIGPQEPTWVSLTLQLDAVGCHEPQFHWASIGREALAVLREQSFDCVLISTDTPSTRLLGRIENEPPFDALALVQSIRNSGYDDPVIVVTAYLSDADWVELSTRECEIVITPERWESRALIAVMRRAIEHVELRRENHRHSVGNHRRLVRERDEAEHLLSQQRQILGELSRLSETVSPPEPDLPPAGSETVDATANAASTAAAPWQRFSSEIADFYHELLRAYVIMGSGGLGNEIAKVAELIAFTGLKPREAMQLHLERVEALVRGLGSRSSRHVMARADLMALELMIHLGESYQKQATSRTT